MPKPTRTRPIGGRDIGKYAESKSDRRGRPVEKQMPDPIPDTLENIAKAVLNTPPKKEGDWKYLKKKKG